MAIPKLTEEQLKKADEVMRYYHPDHRPNILYIIFLYPDWPVDAIIDYYEGL